MLSSPWRITSESNRSWKVSLMHGYNQANKLQILHVITITIQQELIKLNMAANNSAFKLGVLNMTICFEPPRSPRKMKRNQEAQTHTKIHPTPSFIPRYSLPRTQHPLTERQEDQMSPYQYYRRSHNDSIRYFRQHNEIVKNSRNFSGLSPKHNKTIQLDFHQAKQQSATIPVKSMKDNHLKLVFTKRHLRNSIDLATTINAAQNFALNLQTNPEENLKNIFTVRPIKTSERTHKPKHHKQIKQSTKPSLSRQQVRRVYQEPQMLQKKIRPWSPTRNFLNKESLYESEMLDPNESHQTVRQ